MDVCSANCNAECLGSHCEDFCCKSSQDYFVREREIPSQCNFCDNLWSQLLNGFCQPLSKLRWCSHHLTKTISSLAFEVAMFTSKSSTVKTIYVWHCQTPMQKYSCFIAWQKLVNPLAFELSYVYKSTMLKTFFASGILMIFTFGFGTVVTKHCSYYLHCSNCAFLK